MAVKVVLGTDILPIVRVGMYQSLLSPENMFDDWLSSSDIMEKMTPEEIEYCEEASSFNFDSAAYAKVIAKYAMEAVTEFFKDINDVIKVTLCGNAKIYSPPYYNYTTDEMDFEIEIEGSEIQKIKEAVKGNRIFFEWLKDTYRSYPGFICFMPNCEEEFTREIESDDKARALAAYFTFLLRKHLGYSGNEEFGNDYILYEKISESHGIAEFVDDKRFHEIMDRTYEARRAQ